MENLSLLAVVTLLCCNGMTSGSSHIYTMITDFGGTCKFPGYAPNGYSPTISDVTPATVEKPTSALAEIAGIGGSVAGKIATVAEKIESLSALVPALGVIAGAFGKVQDMNKVGTEEIINKVNEGFVRFAKEVNDRLKETKNYVDHSVVTAIAGLARDELEKMQKMWTGCTRAPTDKAVKSCQERTAHYINSGMSHFGYMSDTINYPIGKSPVKKGMQKAPNAGPSTQLLRKVELKLPVFRMYATLRMMVNRVGANMLKKNAIWYKKYLKDLKTAASESVKYAEWASYWIEYKNCPQYYTPEPLCSPNQEDKRTSGFWFAKKTVTTGVYKYCGAVMVPYMSPEKCYFKMYAQLPRRPNKYARAQQQGGGQWKNTPCPLDRPSYGRLSVAEWERRDKSAIYHCLGVISDAKWKKRYEEVTSQNCKAATAYVKSELVNILPIWRKVLASVTKELDDFERTHNDVPDLEDNPSLPVVQIGEEPKDELLDNVNDNKLYDLPTENRDDIQAEFKNERRFDVNRRFSDYEQLRDGPTLQDIENDYRRRINRFYDYERRRDEPALNDVEDDIMERYY